MFGGDDLGEAAGWVVTICAMLLGEEIFTGVMPKWRPHTRFPAQSSQSSIASDRA
jgi:hypothetical protein